MLLYYYYGYIDAEVKGEKGSGTTKIKVRGPVWSPMRHRNKIAPKIKPKPITKQSSTPKTATTPKQAANIPKQTATPTTGALHSNSEGSLLNNEPNNKTVSAMPTPIDQRPYSAPMKKDVLSIKKAGPATGVVLTGDGEIEGLIEIHDIHDSFTVGGQYM